SVDYSGSGNFDISSGSLTGGQTVTKGTVTGTITTSNTPELLGNTVTFTGTFTPSGASTGNPGGNADLHIGNNVVSNLSVTNGVVSYSTFTLTQNSYSVFFVYNGDANFSGNVPTNTITQVIKGNTTTSVTTDHPGGAVYGEPVTFTATVTRVVPAAGTPAGSVTFVDITTNTTLGTANLNGSGVASLSVNNILVTNPPAHTIQATYNPASETTGNYFFTSAGTTSQTVTLGHTTTNLNQSSSSTGYGQTVTFTATVSPNAPSTLTPAGSVQFFVDGSTSLGFATLNGSGQASLPVDTLTFGNHAITATYVGDGNYNTSTSNPPITHNVTTVGTTTT